MKKSAFILIPLIFFSCSNSQQNSSRELSTLKFMADNYVASTQWSDEFESEILTNKIKGAQGFNQSVKPNANNIFLSGIESEIKPIFPRIPGFASLDLSLLSQSQISFIKDFCSSFIKGEDCSSYFSSDFLPSFIVFFYDWQKLNFKSESFVIGEPFICSDFIQIPLRFNSAESTKDLWLYLHPEKNTFIQIDFFAED